MELKWQQKFNPEQQRGRALSPQRTVRRTPSPRCTGAMSVGELPVSAPCEQHDPRTHPFLFSTRWYSVCFAGSSQRVLEGSLASTPCRSSRSTRSAFRSAHTPCCARHSTRQLRRFVRSGWPLAIAAGAVRMPPHPAGGLPSPTASAECVAWDRTGCLPAASHTRAHSRFLTRGSSPRALCLEPADHQGRDPLELFELCSLVPVSWRCGHRVGGPGRALGVDVCPGPPLYSDSCTGSSDM